MSPQTPHIPNIPQSAQTSPSPPPVVPPDPPPSTITPSDSIAPQRPIIMAIPPSKRASSQHDGRQVQPSPNKHMNIDDAYLPKEITEIIAARRRQERAWHIRLSICASTLSIYKEDVEREEAELIRKYLREAIACLATSNNAPKPPKIPIATKPNKMKSSNKTNTLKQNKLLIATPKHITCPNLQNVQAEIVEPTRPQKQKEKSWAMVTRNGLKKSRISTPAVNPQNEISPNDVIHLTSRPKTNNKDLGKKVKVENKSDNRLFIRLPLDHEWRKLSPAGLREVIVKSLSVFLASIGLIKPVRSGFALTPCNMKFREDLLSAAGGLFMSGASLEPAPNWIPVLVPTVPKTIITVDGQVERSKLMLMNETKRVSSKRPALVKLYGTANPEAPHRTWLALFSEAPRCGFRVFDESGITNTFKKKLPIEFCKRCLARPTRYGKPTKKQLDAYRRAGDREYQAVVRANAAEARAAIAENTEGANETSSRSQETIISVENPNETPV
ncbi:putative eka-like protein [Erysiphe necator]|uniref:Putative eka-like protein n=1 Tax=Uncinula necator TaxID=52586 RepID=A0A0B1NY20_UNCNE|nr:putative eka-like protein [Erysiphe necator]